MYQGANKGGGGVVGWGAGAAPSSEDLVDAAEAFESSSGNEGVICEDPRDPEGGSIIAVAHLSKEDGSVQWSRSTDPDYVLRRTVSMSQMTSMLRDIDRNNVYEDAIKICIQNFIDKEGRAPVALDIGTGTGMLALASARAGAHPVFACEMFQKMASIAADVVTANGMDDHVAVIPYKSSDVSELPMSPDIVLSELLDSALLGEAVIMAHSDAINRFMDPNASHVVPIQDRVIPNRSYVFGSLIESTEVRDMRSISGVVREFDLSPYRSPEAKQCVGGAVLIPVHWREFAERGSRQLSGAHQLAEFNFYQLEQPGAPFESGVVTKLSVAEGGTVHGVLMWWETKLLSQSLDPIGALSYSTSPDSGQNWQDHWVQVVIPFTGDGHLASKGDVFTVSLHNDGVNMWLDLVDVTSAASTGSLKRKATALSGDSCGAVDPIPSGGVENDAAVASPPLCTCGWHLLCGAERLQSLNDSKFSVQWRNCLQKIVDNVRLLKLPTDGRPIRAVDASDGSVLSLGLARIFQSSFNLSERELSSALNIISVERKIFSKLFFSQLAEGNALADVVTVVDDINDISECWNEEDEAGVAVAEKPLIDILFSECYYFQLNSQPSWQAISFLYTVNALRPQLATNAVICPARARIMCAAVHLPDLYRSHGLVGSALGFDHAPLNEVQKDWADHMYPYKIAEYKYTLLTDATVIGELDYTTADVTNQSTSKVLNCSFTSSGRCDAVLIWVDYVTDAEGTTQTTNFCQGGRFPHHTKVAIKFFEDPEEISVRNDSSKHASEFEASSSNLHVKTNFTYGASDFSYSFSVLGAAKA